MRSILVVTDLSSSEMDVAVARAAHLACAHDATLKLMYAPADRTSTPADAGKLLASLAAKLEQDRLLRTMTIARTAVSLRDVATEARDSDLVVFPDRRERSISAFFLGQPVQRLLKMCERPVLLARTVPRAHYARILIAVDLRDSCRRLLEFAGDLDPLARLELFHAIDARGEAHLKAADVSEHAIRAYRESRLLGAQDDMVRLTDAFGVRRNRVMTALGRGDAGRQIVIQQEHTGADLVVVGADRAAASVPLFAGGAAHRVLALGSSDVLVMPRGHAPSTRSAAVRRLSSDHPPSGRASVAVRQTPA
jgi:nucleotide-binding universal stress UspA family protein